jgi:hypothetical protein
MQKETGKLPTPVGRRKVEMSDKRQPISLKLDPELAQALREMKQGHDESVSDVIIRLLRKLVRQNPAGARGARSLGGRGAGGHGAGFPSPKGAAGRGAFGTDRRGKAMAPNRPASRGAARGKPFVAREEPAMAEWATGDDKREPAAAWAPQRPARGRTGKVGKPFRPRPIGGSSKEWRRDYPSPKRAGASGARANPKSDGFGRAERSKRPRKAKGRRSNRG